MKLVALARLRRSAAARIDCPRPALLSCHRRSVSSSWQDLGITFRVPSHLKLSWESVCSNRGVHQCRMRNVEVMNSEALESS